MEGHFRRAAIVGATVVYLLAYYYSYVTYTSVTWDYFGVGFNPKWPAADMAFFTLLALLPACWLPSSVRRPSSLFLLLQYFLIYIPTLFIAQHATVGTLSAELKSSFSIALFSGMVIMIGMQRTLPLLAIPRISVPPKFVWMTVTVCLGLAFVFLWTILNGEFELVGLADIYSVRDRVTEILERRGGRLGGYAFVWANAVFLPFLMAQALTRHRWWLVLGVLAGYGFLFGVWAAKTSLFAPVYLCLFFVLLGLREGRIPATLAVGLSMLLLVPVLFGDPGAINPIREAWVGVVNMRVFAMPSLALVEYMDFFQRHALTFGSHITGLSWLIEYPYDLDVPRTVGYHYYGALMTANVNFWAQDGLASLGILGVPTISVLAALTLWLLDSVSAHLPMRFVGTALAGIAISFLGGSLFTTLLTGGLLLMMILLWVLRGPGDVPAGNVRGYRC